VPIDKRIGVDGCKAGWFFIAIDPGDELEFGIFVTIEKLWRIYSESTIMSVTVKSASREGISAGR